MNCPKCGSSNSKIVTSKNIKNYVKRRRQCLDCKNRFNTFEFREDTVVDVKGEDTEEAKKPEKKKSAPARSDSDAVFNCLKGINKKLNIIAQALAADIDVSAKQESAGLKKYESEILADLGSAEDPDPSDIHAWAVLLASLSGK